MTGRKMHGLGSNLELDQSEHNNPIPSLTGRGGIDGSGTGSGNCSSTGSGNRGGTRHGNRSGTLRGNLSSTHSGKGRDNSRGKCRGITRLFNTHILFPSDRNVIFGDRDLNSPVIRKLYYD